VSRGLHLGVLVMCASRNGIPMAMTSGRFIEQMGMREGRKITTNMGVLLQERYRAI
jgi:hypothetical protein